MKAFVFLPFVMLLSITGCAQNNSGGAIGGGCEGCEAIFESPIPFEQLDWIDTLPDYTNNERWHTHRNQGYHSRTEHSELSCKKIRAVETAPKPLINNL